MRCTFVGVGDGNDAKHSCSCLHLEVADKSILFDCGFSSAYSFFNRVFNPAALNVLYITHFHGGHYFGVPALLSGLYALGRTETLHICGPKECKKKINEVINLAYPLLLGKIKFNIEFHEFDAAKEYEVDGIVFKVEETKHRIQNLAVRVQYAGNNFFYSGDGELTRECKALVAGSDIAVFEAYGLDEGGTDHSSVKECLDFITGLDVNKIAMIHLNYFIRAYQKDEVLEVLEDDYNFRAIVPEEGDTLIAAE